MTGTQWGGIGVICRADERWTSGGRGRNRLPRSGERPGASTLSEDE